jgi:LmbE family N-acetylglucosaminyl deacetylase
MAVLVCFHAHPDDEAIATGGAMARAAAEGHRVVLVVATRGEHGEVVPGVLSDGEQLGLRRVHETAASAQLLGVHRVEFLGYVDSGMMGEPTNDEPYAFWSADVDRAARRLAAILEEEAGHGPVVLTVYDDHGGYGHPDHIQVHRVGMRAAEMVPVERVFQATMNRDQIRAMMSEQEAEARATMAVETAAPEVATGASGGDGPSPERMPEDMRERLEDDESPERFGEPESAITHAVDVRDHLDVKLACMRAHASQIAEDSFFLSMGPESFAQAFGTEWFVQAGHSRAPDEPFGTALLSGLD